MEDRDNGLWPADHKSNSEEGIIRDHTGSIFSEDTDIDRRERNISDPIIEEDIEYVCMRLRDKNFNRIKNGLKILSKPDFIENINNTQWLKIIRYIPIYDYDIKRNVKSYYIISEYIRTTIEELPESVIYKAGIIRGTIEKLKQDAIKRYS